MAKHKVSPGGNNLQNKIQGVINKADPGDTIVFQKGTYKNMTLKIDEKKGLTLSGESAKSVKMVDVTINLNCHDVTVENFTFVGGSSVNAKVNKVKDDATMGKNAVIQNNIFQDLPNGYSKRIRVASSSKHEAIDMNTTIQGNHFSNLHGHNNKRPKKDKKTKKMKTTPGGEIISVKAGGAMVRNNTFDNVWGMISLRGGEQSHVEGNTFNNLQLPAKPKYSTGIQVYGSHNTVMKNNLTNKGVILIGAGQADTKAGEEPKGDHLPAKDAVIEGNTAGTRILNYNYGKKYPYKATGVKESGNHFKNVCNQADGKKK